MKMFDITRVYNDANGDSYFEDITIPLKASGSIGFLSEAESVKEIIFREGLPSYDYDFHTAPQRQYIILLDGEIEIETSRGDRKQFKAGDILLVEDTEGKGHKTKNLTPVRRRSVFITLP